jgi:hypothetical protein
MFKKISTTQIAITIVIIVVIALNWKYLNAQLNTLGVKLPSFSGNNRSTTDTNTMPEKLNCDLPLKKGIQGPEVKQLQTWMLMVNKNILPNYGADGDFGQETLSALQSLTGQSATTLKAAQTLLNTKLSQLGLPQNIVSVC